MAIKPVAERPVVTPVSDAPVTNPVTPTPVKSRVTTKQPIATPVKRPVRRNLGKIKTPVNPVPVPKPIKPKLEKASTDPWKTGW